MSWLPISQIIQVISQQFLQANIKETSKLHITTPLLGESTNDWFAGSLLWKSTSDLRTSSQRDSNVENASMSWHHHAFTGTVITNLSSLIVWDWLENSHICNILAPNYQIWFVSKYWHISLPMNNDQTLVCCKHLLIYNIYKDGSTQ